MDSTLALNLFALSQRSHDREGVYTRLWLTDLRRLLGMDLGGRADLRAVAAAHPDVVFPDPGRIGSNLSYYLAREFSAWADVFPGMTEDDVYAALADAGIDAVTQLPRGVAKALPARLLAVAA